MNAPDFNGNNHAYVFLEVKAIDNLPAREHCALILQIGITVYKYIYIYIQL